MGRVSVQPERLTISLTARALTIDVCDASAARSAKASADPSTELRVGPERGRGAERNHEVIAWDRAGRLYSVWRDGRTFRRGLSGHVLQKWRDGGETRRCWLDEAEADALVDDAASRAAEALAQGARANQLAVLGRAAAFGAVAAREDAARFGTIYSDIGILPPDQYLATIVQATEGCSFRTCEFCDLFERPYRVKPLDEFRDHAAAVLAYMGESMTLRNRSVFVGAANALALPASRLAGYFAAVRETFGMPIAGFIDGHTGAVKTSVDYDMLRQAGLRRVYVGLESGHDPLLDFVRKPSKAAETVDAVRAMKAGGLSVAVIVIVGLGGERFDAAHVADTAAVLNRMPLGTGDLIYFSDLVAQPSGRYAAVASSAGIVPLDHAARSRQRREIRSRLRFASAPPQIATYDIREFVY